MNWADYCIVVALVLSVLMGLWRGFIGEVLALACWALAFWVAWKFGDRLAASLTAVDEPSVRLLLGYAICFIAVLIAGAIPFAAIGLCIGSLVSASAAPGYANLFYLPCIYLSGLFIPLPKSMEAQMVIWPAFHVNQLALAAGEAAKFKSIPPQMSVALLVGITVICGGLAIWRIAKKG